MKVSVIVPVYNAMPWLEECLDSLFCQELSAQEYEVICINDGSTDGSGDLLCTYRERHPNLLVISQPNSGVVAARNAGIARASGEYIWFVDADDRVAHNALSRLCDGLDDRMELLQFGGYQFENTLTVEEETRACRGNLPCNAPGTGSVVWRNLIRRDFLIRNALSFRHPQLTHGEDGQFLYELLSLQPQTQTLPDILYFYRVREGSAETASSAQSQLRRYRSHVEVVRIMKGYYDSGRRDELTANRLMLTLWLALYDIAAFPLSQAVAQWKALKREGLCLCSGIPECTVKCSYMFDMHSPLGRGMDAIYRKQHHPLGLCVTWLARHLLALARKLG